MRRYILAINPGSTSTKVAIFEGDKKIIQSSLNHSSEEISKFEKISEQYEFRENAILNWLKENEISPKCILAVVGRGGLLRSMPSGVYKVTDAMIEDLKIGIQGEHASNLGGIIAKKIGDIEGIPSYIVDPVAVDEFDEIARISGIPEIKRKSLVHALNIRAVSRKVAKKLNKDMNDLNLIVAHLGGGISVAPLRKGKIIDVNNASDDGPFSPERTGGLPAIPLIQMAYSGEYTYKDLKKKIAGKGGLSGYLNTNDAREVQNMIDKGDKQAELVLDAMAYQIGKEIGSVATLLYGNVDRIILTGGLAYSKRLTDYIVNMVGFIAPVEIVPGEDEMQSLAEGANRALKGEEEVKIYENEVDL